MASNGASLGARARAASALPGARDRCGNLLNILGAGGAPCRPNYETFWNPMPFPGGM